MKNKQEETVIEGFKSIIEEAGNIKIVGFDGGSEFQNKFKALLKSHGVEYYVSDPNDKNKMAMVERFNRTVREKIEKYLTAYKTNKWFDVLHLLMENYNNTIHSSIGVTPNKFSKKDYDKMQEKNLDKIRSIKQEKESFIVGDKVRVLKPKTVFEKGATERYYRGIYEISKVNAFSYKVKNDTGSELKKTIKTHELLKVDHVESLEIEKPYDREKEVKEHKRERKFKIEGVDVGNIIPSKRETQERTMRHERQGVDVGNIISTKRRI
jgi:hypothetical protein